LWINGRWYASGSAAAPAFFARSHYSEAALALESFEAAQRFRQLLLGKLKM
jgi:hypothetical protein